MSKQNRRSSGSFRTLGQRMLSFGRGIMRTYANETSLQPDTPSKEPSRPQGQWRSMMTDSLIWRQEQQATPATPPPAQPMPDADYGDDYYEGDYADYDDMGLPIQRQPQPRRQQPIQRQPQQPQQPRPQKPKKPTPTYIQTEDGTPVQTSRKQFSSPLQRRLDAIMAAHEEKNAERDQQRDQKIENIQRKVEKGEMTTRRRRGSIDVDYVQTESLLPPDERGKEPATPIQTQRETTDSGGDTTDAADSGVGNDGADEANWFDEIPDDDADIDSIAGFESTDDAVQRMPDDLPQFDPSFNEEENPDDMGEFEGGYDDFSSPSPNANDVINRDYDEATYSDFGDSSQSADTPVQRTAQESDYTLPLFDDMDNDETVPLIPNMDLPDVGSPTPPTNTPVQRTESDDESYSDYADEDAGGNSYTDFPNVDGSATNDAPVQRNTIQRTPSDDTPSFTDFSVDGDDAGGNSYTDFPNMDGSATNDAPVQRNTIQRTSSDDTPSFTDFGVDGDDRSVVNDAPVQRNTIQRTPSDDTPSFTDDESYTDFPDVNEASSNDMPVQRAEVDDEAYDDGNDSFTDFSDVSESLSNDAPVQRNTIQRTEFDDDGELGDESYTDFPDVGGQPRDVYDDDDYYTDFTDSADVETQPSNDAPVQPNPIQRQEFDTDFDDSDLPSDDAGSMESLNNAPPADITPVQRQVTDPSDLDDDGEYSDYGDATWAEMNDYSPASDHSDAIQREAFDQPEYEDDEADADIGDMPDVGGQVSDAPVQREAFDQPEYEDDNADHYGDLPDVGGQVNDAPVQREVFEQPEYEDDYSDVNAPDMDFHSGDALSIQPSAIQRSEMDERTFDIIDNADSLSIDSPTDHAVQRSELDEPQNDYDDYGDATWAEMNDYSPATDSATSSETPIQRDLDDTAPYEPYVEDDYDHLEDTDGLTAMNILNDHLSGQSGNDAGSESSGGNSLSIQRRYDDETYDYLPDDFDPTPTFYDFDQQADNPVDSTPGQDTPIQREMMGSDQPNEQPIDLFQALSQAGMIDTPPSKSTPTSQAPIQRDYQDDGDDYSDYGDATWAEVHNYSPATDNAHNGDSPIQRTPADEPMDLFQAMSQAGMLDTPQSPSDTSDASIQRDYQEDGVGDDNNEMMDLYNAMMQAGMIQDSSKSEGTSSHRDPIQRSSQPESSNSNNNIAEALMRASQVSESSSANNNQSNNTTSSDSAATTVMSKNVLQRAETEDPVAMSDNVTSPSINMSDTDDKTEEEDKEYLSQLARDVFRVIKRRLREEKERRG